MTGFKIEGVFGGITENKETKQLCVQNPELLRVYVRYLQKENERLQKELSLLLLSQITENDQKLGLYEGTIYE